MPNGDADELAELISAPLEELIVALGSGIGRAQAELDRNSIEIERVIAEDPVLAQYDLSATWYQIPSTDLELRMAIAMQRPAGPPPPSGPLIFKAPKMWVQPVNASYVSRFAYDINAASTVKLSVVAVPPPGRAAAGTPESTVTEVVDAARSNLVLDSAGEPAPRLTVNFNAGARAWYVVQTSEEDDETRLERLVKIEDGTLAVLKVVGGS
jgi:hypothetical protein